MGAAGRRRRISDPREFVVKEARTLGREVKRGELTAAKARAMIACLRLVVALADHTDTAARFSRYDAEIARLEARIRGLQGRG